MNLGESYIFAYYLTHKAESVNGLRLSNWDALGDLNALIIAVAHKFYKEKPAQAFIEKIIPNGCIIDVKSILDPIKIGEAGLQFRRL